MLTNEKKIKILLYGNVFLRDYRSKMLTKFLHESEYNFSLVSPGFYRTKTIKNFFSTEKLLIVFCWLELFVKAAFADLIYLPPMNARFIKSAVWVAKILKKKLAVEMYISLYDTLVQDRGLLKNDSRQAKDWKKKDILALTKADYIIHTAHSELNYWEKLLDINIDFNKVLIAPICSVSSVTLKRKFRQDGVLRICWWGTFIPLHGLDNILQAMKILQESKLPFTCDLFGVDKPEFVEYASKIQFYKLEKNICLRKDLSFSNDSLPMYLVDNCDLALGIFGNTDKAHNAVPNKLIEALSMGIPTLTMNSPALREFFNPEIDFWTCEPSPEAIAESILKIAAGEAYSVDWKQTRQKVLSTFSVTQYQDVINQILERVKNDLLSREDLDVKRGEFTTHQTRLN